MEILPADKRSTLLEYLTLLRYSLRDWLIVEIKILDHVQQKTTGDEIAQLLNGLFKQHEGRVLVCNAHEALMLIEWGHQNNPTTLAKQIRSHVPEDDCEITVNPPTKEGLVKIQMSLAPGIAENDNPLHQARLTRQGNVIMVADDDMYMRLLAKKGLEDRATIVEVSGGNEIAAAYRQHNPDMVLLDIHMPERDGHEILAELKAIDKKAYVIMVSADSSVENVQSTLNHGAKGFVAKPFVKQKLVDYADKCPTIY